MKNFFEKLSQKLKLTLTELRIFLFLIVALISGIVVNIWKSSQKQSYLEFNYAYQDSLFFAASGNLAIDDSSSDDESDKFDSKKEVSDFTKEKKEFKKKLDPHSNQKIKINFATEEILSQLPGIGQKTAKNIIEYRKKVGSFSKAEDLLNIKGIGNSKLEKIRMLLNFEK